MTIIASQRFPRIIGVGICYIYISLTPAKTQGASGSEQTRQRTARHVPEKDTMTHPNSFGSRSTLEAGGRSYTIYRLDSLNAPSSGKAASLPFSLKILLENLLRNEDGKFVKKGDIETLASWDVKGKAEQEIAFRTARVLLQDFTGVPAVVDLAAMRDALAKLGGDPKKINPLQPVDLVIDHSVQVDEYGSDASFLINANLEFTRNQERVALLVSYTHLRAHETDSYLVCRLL